MNKDRAAQLKARRAKLQASLAARRARQPKSPKKPRRTGWIPWALCIVLLLLLLRECSHECPEHEEEPCICEEPVGEPVDTEAAPSEPALGGRVRRKNRSSYRSGSPAPLSWIAAFRLQVAARSTRLATCFQGAERPGTLKWTTSVEPVEGRVSEHALEPMIDTASLTTPQRTCVLGVLSSPTYDLVTGDEPATPSRVGLVIEF